VAVFLGIRPYDQEFHNTGRETFLLPVRWQEEWPIILEPQTAVPRQLKQPDIQAAEPGIPPQSGNFVWLDDFDAPELNAQWLRLRTSTTEWTELDSQAEVVRLTALPIPLWEKSQPAYLARVQQHLEFSASTRMELPRSEGIAAGLAAFQSSDFHYFLGVRKAIDGYLVFLEEVREGIPRIIASTEIETASDYIVLGLEQESAKIGFYYSLSPPEHVDLASNVDAKLLSTQVAGGFVGATVGIHARRE